MNMSKFLTLLGSIAAIVPMLPVAGLPNWVSIAASIVAFGAGKLAQTPLKPSAPSPKSDQTYGDSGSP